MKVAALILAAGGSARMGEPKQLLRYAGQALVRRMAEAAHGAGCDPIFVVVGRDRAKIAAELENLAVTLVTNDDWERGLGSSLRAGMARLPAVEAVLILACDQPHVRADLLRNLVATQRESGQPMVASAYAGTIGVPALFTAGCFADLRSLGDDTGAKSLLRARPDDVATVAFAEGAIDLDTPKDYRRATASRQRNPGTIE